MKDLSLRKVMGVSLVIVMIVALAGFTALAGYGVYLETGSPVVAILVASAAGVVSLVWIPMLKAIWADSVLPDTPKRQWERRSALL